MSFDMLDFDKLKSVAACGESVVPVVVQDVRTKDVLILGYTNREALEKTVDLGRVVLYSTSRKSLWDKGATSGNILKLESIRVNCENNSLLYLVEPLGEGVCHTKDEDGKYRKTCFYRDISMSEGS
jgi:phosphoribosyl-AMP cyclohydrolase